MSDRECAADATAKESLAQTRKIPYNKAVLDEQIEEERRLFYVAITRAIKNLRVLYIDDFEEIKDGIEKVFEKAYAFTNEISIDDF